jgi:tartrate/fumarate subfamily iron-sulfur-dependent hydro-lyase beta chain
VSKEYVLETPISEEAVRRLAAGDMVFLRGEVIAMKTAGYARALGWVAEGKTLPADFEGAAIYHCFTALDERGGGFKTHYLGPTLSYRYSELASRMIRELGVRAFIGKMGAPMDEGCLEAMTSHGCVHLGQIGGVTAYNSQQLEGPIRLFWPDLVLGERCLVYRTEAMGPLVVSMDTRGGNHFARVNEDKHRAVDQALQEVRGMGR